jgi:chromosome partitioning protein
MAVISILNRKGGVGKSTLSLHLAYFLSKEVGRTLLVDADPQGSIRDWAGARSMTRTLPFALVAIDRPSLHRDLPNIASDFVEIVIDSPPREEAIVRSIIMASDLIVIPVQPSPMDVWAAESVIALIEEVAIIRPHLKAIFAVNRKIANSAIGRDVFDGLSSYGIPVSQYAISQRVAFPEAAISGETVMEKYPKSLAALEARLLCSDVLAKLTEVKIHA